MSSFALLLAATGCQTGGPGGGGSAELADGGTVHDAGVDLELTSEKVLAERGPDGLPVLQTEVPRFSLTIAPADEAALEANLKNRDYWVPATFEAYGKKWSVEVRYRGHHTRYLPKRSYSVRFGDARLQGRKRIELLAEWKDGAYLTEKLWYDLAAAAGLEVPGARFVHLTVNGRNHGLMTELERVDKRFLEAHALDADADVYRCGMFDCTMSDSPPRSYQDDWEKQTNEERPRAELDLFLAELNRKAPHELAAFLDGAMEVDAYLTWLAVDAAISNDLVEDSRSYLVRDPSSKKFRYVPWDLNNARSVFNRQNGLSQSVKSTRQLFGFSVYDERSWSVFAEERSLWWGDEGRPAFSVLNTRLYDDPALRARYLAAYDRLLAGPFRPEVLHPRIDAMVALIAPFLADDPFIDRAFADAAPAFLKKFVTDRRAWLSQKRGVIASHGETPLKIDRVGVLADGRAFVQIHNSGAAQTSLGGMFLTADLGKPGPATLPPVDVPPGGVVTFTAGAQPPELSLPVAVDPSRMRLGLFGVDGKTALDVFYAPPLSAGQAYGRAPRGAETFEGQTGP